MSAFGGKADSLSGRTLCPLMTQSGHAYVNFTYVSVAQLLSILALAVADGISVTTMTTDLQWVGWALSGTIIILIVGIQIVRPIVRHLRLKRPFLAYFRGGGSDKNRELTVPANSPEHIQISRLISVTHDEHDLIVGFDGEVGKRPDIVGTENKFIALGLARTADPMTRESHYIDDRGNYHIKEKRSLVCGHTYTTGYKIETKAPGRYPVKILTVTDTGEGRASKPLLLIVTT